MLLVHQVLISILLIRRVRIGLECRWVFLRWKLWNGNEDIVIWMRVNCVSLCLSESPVCFARDIRLV